MTIEHRVDGAHGRADDLGPAMLEPLPYLWRAPVRISETNGAWSPGGDSIAFESNRNYIMFDGKRVYRPEIWVMNADGSNPLQLTDFSWWPTPSNVNVTKPTWSPSGDRIAFHRRVGAQGARGHLQVYTMNADGTDVTQITFTPSPGSSGFPSWGKWSADSIPQ